MSKIMQEKTDFREEHFRMLKTELLSLILSFWGQFLLNYAESLLSK